MPAEQSADASGPTWNWRLPRALPVTSPASCHGGASRAKYPTEPSQNSWRMVAQPAVAPGFPRHPGQCAWPPGAGRPHPFGPLPSPGSYGLRGAAGSGGSCGFGICANLRNSSPPPKTGPTPRARYGGIPTKPGAPPTAHPPSTPSMMSSRITGAQTHRPGPRLFWPSAGPCREYRCRQILRETKFNHRSNHP